MLDQRERLSTVPRTLECGRTNEKASIHVAKSLIGSRWPIARIIDAYRTSIRPQIPRHSPRAKFRGPAESGIFLASLDKHASGSAGAGQDASEIPCRPRDMRNSAPAVADDKAWLRRRIGNTD